MSRQDWQRLAAWALGSALLSLPTGREHVGLAASFESSSAAGPAVAVQFMPLSPDIQVNAEPAPRFSLDQNQRVLDESRRPARPPVRAEPPFAKYLDTRQAVRFPVELHADLKPGAHRVRVRVTYFYCSLAEGWCRRALDDVEVLVQVR